MFRPTLPSRVAGNLAGVAPAAATTATAFAARRRAVPIARAGEPLGSQEKIQPFDEGAAQVARLLARDKRELLGDGADVADFVAASEFAEDGPATSTATAAAAAPAPPPLSSTPASPFGAPPPASPFGGIGFGTGAGGAGGGGGGGANPMAGLGADGAPLFTEAEDFSSGGGGVAGGIGGGGGGAGAPAPWYAGITLTQVVIALSFLLVILAMLATFAFVFRVGAIHFNE